MNVDVYFEICREGAKIPSYARDGDAGMDVFSAKDVTISPGETVVVPTGLKLAIPEGFELQVRPRSGISLNTPLRVSNSPGTIDSGYRGELGIIMTNTSCTCNSSDKIFDLDSKGNFKGTYRIKKGERIAQIVLNQIPKIIIKITDSVEKIGKNRNGGFGSTGLK
ncbi:MAG TPA: dUTP diphosphatase [Clostridiaceae bacterium]|nr:dUTP diphosphatase [Clostridiaceae bacterium]